MILRTLLYIIMACYAFSFGYNYKKLALKHRIVNIIGMLCLFVGAMLSTGVKS